MPIKNYTTTVPASRTVGQIQEILASKGAQKIMIDYESGVPMRIYFVLETSKGLQPVMIDANADKVFKVLERQRVKVDANRANMVAWRNVKDWLDAQLAILETEMVTIDQVMLPYFCNNEGRTVYEMYCSNTLMLE